MTTCARLALALLLTAILAAAPVRAERVYWNDELASELIGKSVVNKRGARVGAIADLILDLRRGSAPFALVESRGILGLGTRVRAFPVSWLAPGKREGVVVLDIDAVSLDTEGKDPPPGPRASEILGRMVRDVNGREAGELRDVVVNLGDGKLRHAVIMLEQPQRQVTVRPELLAVSDDAVVVDMELAHLRALVMR